MKSDNVYDAVFLTNIPSFYKVNLFNEIHKHKKILVIFVARYSNIRNDDFYSYDFHFDAIFLNNKCFETRNKIKTLYSLLRTLYSISYNRLIFSGWEAKEITLASLLNRRKKNAVVIESSIIETKKSGIAWLLKKIAIKRMSIAYPSGQLQKKVLEALSFNGRTVVTHGVGLSSFVHRDRPATLKRKRNEPLRFIYIGRLSPEKNVEFMMDAFKNVPYELLLIGDGVLRKQLEIHQRENIKFLGYINNEEVLNILASGDCFILPSLSEPWGLVVEEALISGIPVIVSNHVGCHGDIVNNRNGIVFDVNNQQSLIDSLISMDLNYEQFASGAREYDANKMEKIQVDAYVSSI